MAVAPLSRIIPYVRDIPTVAAFYQTHLGCVPIPRDEPGSFELSSPAGGCTIALHQASKAQKRGSEIKLGLGVDDVHAFRIVQFGNASDPAGNSISMSNRNR